MRFDMSKLRTSRSDLPVLVAALLLAAFIASLGIVSFQRKVESFQVLGFKATVEDGRVRVLSVSDPGVALAVDDQILVIDARQVDDLAQAASALRAQPESRVLVLRDGVPVTVDYQRPALEVDVPYLILTAIALLYLLIGLYTVFKDRHSPSRLFFLWCLASVAFLALSPIRPPQDAFDKWIYQVDQVARTLVPFLTLHLFLVFPTHLFERGRRALPFLYLPPALLLAVHFDVFGAVSNAQRAGLAELEGYLLIVGALLAAATLVVRLARRPAWEQRRQTQWLLFGMFGGTVPILLLYLVPRTLGVAMPAWVTAVAVVPMGLIPLTLAWAIFKYQLLDLPIILRNTASWALTALAGLFGFALFQLALRSGLADGVPISRTLLTFVVGAAIAGALAPARNAIAVSLERLQHRAATGPRQMLGELGQKLLHERDLDRLCSSLREHLEDALMVRANLYLAQGGAMVPVVPAPDLPRELPFDVFGVDFWERDSAAIPAIGLPSAEVSPGRRLFALGYRYALPLTVRDQRIGVVLVSYKFDEDPLDSEDLDIVRGLLNQAALAIENAQLLSEVHRRLLEVIRLEEFSNGILESSPAGIAALDDDGRVVSANHAFAAIAGVERPETRGRSLEDLVPIRPLPDPGTGPVEVSFCEPSGEERYLQLSVARYRRQNDDLRILIVQDVSERVSMEQALREKERLASLGLLAAGVAHEVNTPLTGISSYAQMLLADIDENDPRYKILKKMERQTFRAAQIVNNLLSFARHRNEQLASVDLAAVIGECVQLLEDRAAGAGVELRWNGVPPCLVSGHEGELHQVFNNLIVNGIDALGVVAGTDRWVEIALEGDERRVRARISDNGPGIPPDRLESVFQPFFSSKLSKGGIGLGLAITYNIVHRHGGEIRAENHPGGSGCTFTIELPRLGWDGDRP